MADFKRKTGENFESFLRRFKKGLRNSKRLEEARNKQHYQDRKSKREQKKYALTSLKLKKKTEYLRKIGKLDDDNK
ncbi:MAG: 30S ribosomal protein S21 [Candidatus Pacebacteria bacterium]|nr:30S ribosomal protein S21 [Candidatus Paceibacterota bacterium]